MRGDLAVIRFFFCFLLALGSTGCGYQLGSIQTGGQGQTVAVPTFANKTGEPNLETRATNAIIEQIKIDGTYKVVGDPSQADYVLEGELTQYSRDPIAFDRSDTTREYRSILTAKVIFKEAKTDKILWTASRVQGEVVFSRGGDQAENERAAFPKLTRDLAKYVVEKVVNGGW